MFGANDTSQLVLLTSQTKILHNLVNNECTWKPHVHQNLYFVQQVAHQNRKKMYRQVFVFYPINIPHTYFTSREHYTTLCSSSN